MSASKVQQLSAEVVSYLFAVKVQKGSAYSDTTNFYVFFVIPRFFEEKKGVINFGLSVCPSVWLSHFVSVQ